MEKYVINGVEVEYDTFDIDEMDDLRKTVNRLQENIKVLQEEGTSGEDSLALLQKQAELFLDFFDDVLGDGSAKKIFGDRINILAIANGFREFIDAVTANQAGLGESISKPKLNRDQRRAAARFRR